MKIFKILKSIQNTEAGSPFNVIMGWRDTFFQPFVGLRTYPDVYARNMPHLTLNNKDKLLVKEIGTYDLYLDNLNVDRRADFRAAASITAGNRSNSDYVYSGQYPNIASLNSPNFIYSDTNYFTVSNTGGAVKFISPSITLEGGFEVETGAYFETLLDTETYCNLPVNYYDNNSPFPSLPENDSLQNDDGKNITLNLFPNPNDGNFTLFVQSETKLEENIPLEVFDMAGRTVYQENKFMTSNVNMIFDLGLKAGVYFLKLNIHSKTFNKKIVCTKSN